ncbi:MAG: hypothetical protein KAI81_00285, partial [Candidatus Marinimicrobia bacterium]|nr:hypothetical protein [Candidatus Neomarinimicrobiota bacterium]
TSQPWFAANQIEKYKNLVYSYQVFVPINENAVIFNGRIINHGANKIKVKIQPEFDITRPYINDHYEKYSNIYIDEYVLTFGFPGGGIPDEFDGIAVPEIMTVSAGEVKNFTFVITISDNHNKAVALYEKIGSENNLEDYVSRGWENWLAKGRVPVFEDSLLTNYYKINLTSLKAMNLNGAIPMSIFRGKLPQLSPRDAFLAGRAFLESGQTKEINNILKFWAVRPMKQEGEWYVSYDASGSPSRESDERFSRQEWDTNGYYASLIFRRLIISGKLSGNLDFVRSLLQFSSDHLHGNNLLYEGGIIGRPAYISGTNMILSTSYFQAYELAVRVSRWLEADEYLKTGKKIVSGLQAVWDENTQAYMDVNDNSSMWNTTSLYGWIWGYPDHKEFALTSEYYWQNCRKDKGGIQYFEGNDYGDDLFITTSAALAQYYAYRGFDRRYFQLIRWMKDHSNEYGHFPERIKYPKGEFDSQERISSSSRSNAEFVMALQRGALFGQFEGNEALQDDYLNAFHKYYFSGKERDSLLKILSNDSLLATS